MCTLIGLAGTLGDVARIGVCALELGLDRYGACIYHEIMECHSCIESRHKFPLMPIDSFPGFHSRSFARSLLSNPHLSAFSPAVLWNAQTMDTGLQNPGLRRPPPTSHCSAPYSLGLLALPLALLPTHSRRCCSFLLLLPFLPPLLLLFPKFPLLLLIRPLRIPLPGL
jgi:hypothetical protein